MSEINPNFTGKWLHTGERQGKDFGHSLPEYNHEEQSGASATKMRHAVIDRAGKQVGVWVPTDWTDDQVQEALNSNW